LKLVFSKEVGVDSEKLIDIATDYELIPKLFPVEIIGIENINDSVIITEKISFYKFGFLQKSSHIEKENCVLTKILTGPLSGSIISLSYEKTNSGTKIIVDAELKLSLKYRLLGSFIKKRYKKALSRILNETASLAFLTKNRKWKECLVENRSGLIISWNNSKPITMYNWDPWTLSEIFYDEDYAKLPVQNKIVIDIGGFNGDSAIYFTLKGAAKVISLEPFPKNYEIANKNIYKNNFENTVVLLNAACAKENGFIKINSDYVGSDNIAKNEKLGVEIPTMNLENLVNYYNVIDGCLKIDCEGCEYDILLSCPKNILRRFSHIMLEFHHGTNKIVKKLNDCNYRVDIKFLPNYKNNSRGYIFASKS
jgi:FkbM family methyltransferase